MGRQRYRLYAISGPNILTFAVVYGKEGIIRLIHRKVSPKRFALANACPQYRLYRGEKFAFDAIAIHVDGHHTHITDRVCDCIDYNWNELNYGKSA